MIIANPIYDVTFKRLLENDRAAKFLIGAILGCEVLSLVPTTQEHKDSYEKAPKVVLFWMNFVATIMTKEGGEKRVIIEMQKANALFDVYRLRKYLNKECTVSTLPIITIYIFGFTLSVDSPAFCNVPCHRDLLTNENLNVRDLFVELLTHSAYFIQTPRIKPCLNTKLDKVLSIFEQTNFVGVNKTMKNYPYTVDTPEMKAIIDVLQYVATDVQAHRELEKELYYIDAMYDIFGEQDRKFAEIIQRTEESMRKTEESLQREEETVRKIVKGLKEKGMPATEIAKMVEMDEAEIEKLMVS